MDTTRRKEGFVLWTGCDQFEEAMCYLHDWDGQKPIYAYSNSDGDCGIVSETPITKEMKEELRKFMIETDWADESDDFESLGLID